MISSGSSLRTALVLPLPPSTNHLYHPIIISRQSGAPHYSLALTPEARAWKEQATLLARQWALHNHWTLVSHDWVIIWFRLIWPDHRARDIPNLKALWDALEHVIYHNDAQALPRPFIPTYDKQHPRIVLTFYRMGELPEPEGLWLGSGDVYE